MIYVRAINAAKNTVISPNFQVWKFCGKTQFPHNFGQVARNYFRIISSESPETMRKLCLSTNLHTRKLGEIMVFFTVQNSKTTLNFPIKLLEMTLFRTFYPLVYLFLPRECTVKMFLCGYYGKIF